MTIDRISRTAALMTMRSSAGRVAASAAGASGASSVAGASPVFP